MGGKSGGGGRTPYLAPNTLNSKQKIKVVHLLGAGQFNGWQNGNDDPFRSIFFNDTPVKNIDGSHNFNGVKLNWLSGEMNQQYLVGFDATEKTISVGARVRKDYPVIRTITSPEVSSLRVTVGVDSLMEQKDNGDVVGTRANLQVQLVKDGKVVTSRLWEKNEKGSASFQDDLVFTVLPAVPFDIKCVRTMPDSNTDKLRNNTFFFSYVESVDAKFSYPGCAVVGLEFDAEQFGSSLPTITYAVQGKIIQVPSNYDPVARTYSGLWDGLLKPAYSNNPAWVLYDICTDEMDGFGLQMKGFQVDKAKLYEIGRYCDEMIDDGDGGKEPRFVFNGVIQGNDAYTILNNIASVFRGMPVWLGDRLSFVYDQSGLGPVAMYTNANVADGMFTYSHVPLSAIINSVQYEYADERDGCRLRVEELSNDKSIAKYRKLNTEKITVYGATKRSYAVRHAKWHLETAETENQSVTFAIGREGIKHAPYEIIAIADNDFAGDSIGGRILSVAGDVVHFDRALNNPRKVAIFCQDGKSHEFNVIKKLADDQYQVDGMPNAIEYAVFNAWLGKVQHRLFKAISIEENTESGTYTISAVKYNPNKGSVVDSAANGINDSGTIYNPTPVINNPNVTNDGDSVVLGWGTLAVTGENVHYEIKLYKDGELYQTYQQKEPELRLKDLPQGEYVAKIRAKASNGQFSDEVTIAFSTTYKISALRTKGINWGIQINWEVPPLLTSNAHTEIWYGKTNDVLKGSLLAKVPYPQAEFVLNNLSIGDEFYFWVRLVDAKDNRGEFTASVLGKPSNDPKGMLDMLEGQITGSELSKDLLGQLEAGEQASKDAQDALNAVDKEVQDRIAAIQNEANVRANEIQKESAARAAQIETETNVRLTDIKKLNDGLTKETTERKTADSNLQQQVTTLKSSTDANTAAIQSETTARTSADTALGKRIDTVVAESGSNKAAITAEAKARADADSALGVRIDAVQATANGNKASITSEIEARTNADSALGKRIDSVSAKTDTNTASITKVEKAQADDKNAISEISNSISAIQHGIQGGIFLGRDFENKVKFYGGNTNTGRIDGDYYVTGDLVNGQTWVGITNQKFPLIKGIAYKISFDVTQVKSSGGNITINGYAGYDSSGDKFINSIGNNSYGQQHYFSSQILENNQRAQFHGYAFHHSDTEIMKLLGYSERSSAHEKVAYISPAIWTNYSMITGEAIIHSISVEVINLDVVNQGLVVSAELSDFKKAQTSSNEAFTKQLSVTNSNVGKNSAAILKEEQTRVSADNALNEKIESISASVGNAEANIVRLDKAQATHETSLAETVEILTASKDGIQGNVYLGKDLPKKARMYGSAPNVWEISGNDLIAGSTKDGGTLIVSPNQRFPLKNGIAYKITFKITQLIGIGNTTINGFNGYASDGVTYVNDKGSNSSSSQHYFPSRVLQEGETAELYGYAHHSDDAKLMNQFGEIRRVAHEDVYYISPTLWVNYNSRVGKAIIHSITIEEVKISTIANYLDISANISSIKKVQTDDKQSLTQQINTAESKINQNSASITQQSQTMADLNGKLSATYSLKVEAQKDGKKVVAGMAVGVDGATGESQFIVKADKFSVHDGTTSKPVFMIANGKTGINGDLIVDGTILGKHIKANESIQSPNISGGVINAAQFNGGSINIGNGNFIVDSKGNVTASSGKFGGEVYAGKLNGNVLSSYEVTKISTGKYFVFIPALEVDSVIQVSFLVTSGSINEVNAYQSDAILNCRRTAVIECNGQSIVQYVYAVPTNWWLRNGMQPMVTLSENTEMVSTMFKVMKGVAASVTVNTTTRHGAQLDATGMVVASIMPLK